MYKKEFNVHGCHMVRNACENHMVRSLSFTLLETSLYMILMLQTIRNACENNMMGDQLSDHYLSAADDLYHLRIPRIWCQMTGTTAPPYTYNAAQWLRDLEDRWKHFEKILSMVQTFGFHTICLMLILSFAWL